ASSQGNSVGVSRADREPFRLSRQQAIGTVNYDFGGQSLLAAFARVANPPHVQGLDWAVVVEERSDQALGPVNDLQKQVLALLALSLLAIAGAALFPSRRLAQPVNELAGVVARVQAGDLGARARVYGDDELGRVARGTNAMLDEITALVQTREERDVLQQQISKLLDEVSTVAEGDLTVQAEVTADVLGSVADAFNYMVAELRSIIENVNRTTVEVATSTTQILETSGALASQTEAQAPRIVEALTAGAAVGVADHARRGD